MLKVGNYRAGFGHKDDTCEWCRRRDSLVSTEY
jgi:hypothetical protein